MASLASINVKFTADLASFSTQMQQVNKELQKAGKQMQNLGKNLSVGLTAPLVALGYQSVKSFDIQAKAIAQVEAGLKSTGNTAGYTSEQLQKMASELQDNSLFGDEAILKDVTAQLLTFTNISGKAFAGTQQAALDLATRLDGDLKSATIQLGKALNDPKANLSALSRSGIQFSEDQKKVINSLQESGRLAEAQAIILAELEKQYGGSAKAAAAAGAGPLKQLSNSFGDLLEQFGEIILNGISPFIAYLKDLVKRFQDLSPETKKIIVVIAALAASIGPLLVVIGTILTLIPSMVAGFAAVKAAVSSLTTTIAANPFGALAVGLSAIVAVTVVATSRFSDLTNATEEYAKINEVASKSIAKEKTELEKNLAVAKNEKASKEDRIKAIQNLNNLSPEYLGNLTLENINTKEATKSLDKYNEALLTKAKILAAQDKLVDVQKKLLDLQLGQTDAVKPSIWQNLGNAILSYGNSAAFAYRTSLTVTENLGKEYSELEKLQQLLISFLGENNALTDSNISVADSIDKIVDASKRVPKAGTIEFYEAEISKLQKLQKETVTTKQAYLDLQRQIDEFKVKIDSISAPITSPLDQIEPQKYDLSEYFKNSDAHAEMVKRINDGDERLKEKRAATLEAMKAQSQEMVEAWQMVGQSFVDLFGSMSQGFIDSLGIADEGMKSFVSGLVATITKLISMALSASIANSIQGATQSAVATGPGAIFAQPAFIATAISGILAAFASIPKFETGGIVSGTSYFGDKILARVNSGELILNQKQQSRLYDMMDPVGNNVNIGLDGAFKLSGSDLELVIDRAIKKNERKR